MRCAKVIRSTVFDCTMTESLSVRDFWNQKFAGQAYKYGEQPNAFLVQQCGQVPAGARVLVPGDGEGRNGVWLAEQGYQVHSVDCSEVGLDKGRALAERRGVVVEWVHADLTAWAPTASHFDAVVVCYLHLPSATRPLVMQHLLHALKPGGVFILEAFHPSQLGLTSGGPKDVDLLYTLDTLRSDLRAAGVSGHEFVAAECDTTLDEGPFHQGLARVTRLVWQRQI